MTTRRRQCAAAPLTPYLLRQPSCHLHYACQLGRQPQPHVHTLPPVLCTLSSLFTRDQEESGEWLRSSRATAASVTPPRSTVSLSPAPGSLVDSLRANLAASTATAGSQLQQTPPAQFQQQQQGLDHQGAEAAPAARRRPGSPPMIQLDSIDNSGGVGGDPFPGQPHAGAETAADADSPVAAAGTADSTADSIAKAPSTSPEHVNAAVPADAAMHSGDAAPPGGKGDGSPLATAQPSGPAAAAVTTPPTPPQAALRGSAGPQGHELADDASSLADNPFEVL